MAKAPYGIYDIAPNATFAQAAHTAVRQQYHELMSNLEGTRKGEDIEALHDMRVASRRLRSALSVFAAAFPPRLFADCEKQVARVTDALGVVRDADVQVEFLEGLRDKAPESERVGLDAFIDHLKGQRDADRVHLVRALDKLEKGDFRKDFAALLGDEHPGGHAHG